MDMTSYRAGFLSKCAEAGVPEDTAIELCKIAEGSWLDSAKAMGKDIWNNNKTDIKRLGIAAGIGAGANAIRNWMRPKEKRISTFGAMARGGLYGGLAYGGARAAGILDRDYNEGRIGNWVDSTRGRVGDWMNTGYNKARAFMGA